MKQFLRIILSLLGGLIAAFMSKAIIDALTAGTDLRWPYLFAISIPAGVASSIWNSSWFRNAPSSKPSTNPASSAATLASGAATPLQATGSSSPLAAATADSQEVGLQTAPASPTAPDPTIAPAYPSTPTVFSKDYSIDHRGVFKKAHPALRGVLRFVGAAVIMLSLGLLVLGLWPATLIGVLIGLGIMPRGGLTGGWLGDCPTCKKSIVFADPAMSAALTPLQQLCPLCTAPVEVIRNRFVAIPGTESRHRT